MQIFIKSDNIHLQFLIERYRNRSVEIIIGDGINTNRGSFALFPHSTQRHRRRHMHKKKHNKKDMSDIGYVNMRYRLSVLTVR